MNALRRYWKKFGMLNEDSIVVEKKNGKMVEQYSRQSTVVKTKHAKPVKELILYCFVGILYQRGVL